MWLLYFTQYEINKYLILLFLSLLKLCQFSLLLNQQSKNFLEGKSSPRVSAVATGRKSSLVLFVSRTWRCLGLKKSMFLYQGFYTLDIFARNIVIKRYCNKKTFFIQYFFPVCTENIFGDNSKYFEMSLQYFEEKKIFLLQYFFIAISQYREHKCLVCNCP